MAWENVPWLGHPATSSICRYPYAKEYPNLSFKADLFAELKSVTARRRSWRAKEYNSLTQGRPLTPSTQRYYEEQFGPGPGLDYSVAPLYATGGNWQPDAFNGYPHMHEPTIEGLGVQL
jgi:hypothetical protein